MDYEIFTYGGGDYVVEVLNAIVRIMGANTFTTALRISVIFGMFSVFFDIAINGNFTKGVKYYITFLLAYNILFVPKVDVIITDPINQIQTDRKVDNVPFGLALMGHTISTFGSWMTETFGMNFALPDDLQYNKNGLLFGSTLIKNTFNARIPDERTSANFNNYIRQCMIPGLHLNRIKYEDYLKSEGLSDFLSLGSNGVLAYNYIDAINQSNIILCNDTTEITKDITAGIEKLINQQENEFNINGNVSISAVNQYVLGVQQSTTKTFEQTLISNAIMDSTQEYLSMTGADAGATNYAITKDDIQKKQNGALQWLQAGKFLPLLKIVIETMFYALFPIVILLAMLPNGLKIFKSYVLILIALQLWSPLYAILNLIMTLEQKYRIASITGKTVEYISLYNKQAIMDVATGIQSQAGLLAFAIPVLSFKMVSGMQGFAESMISSATNTGSFSTSQVVGEVSSGNLSYGNGSFNNQHYNNTSANKHDTNEVYSSGMKTVQSGDGITTSEYKDGLKTTNVDKRLSSNLGFNLRTSDSEVKTKSEALKEAQSTTSSIANSFAKSVQDIEQFTFADTQASGKSHTMLNSDAIKINAGAGGGAFGLHASIDYDKVMSWADANNISAEDRQTLQNTIDTARRQETSYNEAYSEQKAKEKSYNLALNTSVNSDFNANNEFERHLREDKKWNQEKINYTSKYEPQVLNNMAMEYFSNKRFTSEKPEMSDDVNNSIEIAKNSYNNQNSMIDAQYEYQKNNRIAKDSTKQFQNTDPSNWGD